MRKKACLHRSETDDNWEPYEQVALLREKLIEPDSVEDQESDGSTQPMEYELNRAGHGDIVTVEQPKILQ